MSTVTCGASLGPDGCTATPKLSVGMAIESVDDALEIALLSFFKDSACTPKPPPVLAAIVARAERGADGVPPKPIAKPALFCRFMSAGPSISTSKASSAAARAANWDAYVGSAARGGAGAVAPASRACFPMAWLRALSFVRRVMSLRRSASSSGVSSSSSSSASASRRSESSFVRATARSIARPRLNFTAADAIDARLEMPPISAGSTATSISAKSAVTSGDGSAEADTASATLNLIGNASCNESLYLLSRVSSFLTFLARFFVARS